MIDSFQGEYRFLSNFWPANIEFDGTQYASVENAYQASKIVDKSQRKIFRLCSPGIAKNLGKSINLRPDWDRVKLMFMKDFIKQKFTKHLNLQGMLLKTGDEELVEGNMWGDTFWGVFRGQGQNHLGKILMKVRAEIRG